MGNTELRKVWFLANFTLKKDYLVFLPLLQVGQIFADVTWQKLPLLILILGVPDERESFSKTNQKIGSSSLENVTRTRLTFAGDPRFKGCQPSLDKGWASISLPGDATERSVIG